MPKKALISGVLWSFPLLLVQACSPADGDDTSSSGGVTAHTGGSGAITGGTTSSGGTASSTGGMAVTGGTSSTSGAAATAGANSTSGGSTSTGGAQPSAGRSATGGNGTLGGSAATGGGSMAGASSNGGSSSTGGSSGGGSSKGGSSCSGASSGGSSPKGGSTSGGGSSGGTATGGSSTGGVSSASTGPAETKPTGYGRATTGGGSKAAVDASSMSAVQSAIDGYSGTGGLVIRYTGKFNFSSISDPCKQHDLPARTVEIKKKNDITIIGQDGSAANFGIHIAASSSNIIIRNMVFGLLPGGGDSDVISMEGMSGGVPNNIWIDHNELFTSMAECAGAGDTAFDGLIDLKKGADNVTVSYNYMHDHHKGTLNGYTDDDDQVRHITYHHNIFSNIGSRTPLQRHGYSHLFNNLFSGITVSGANIRMDGYALIEANFFENAKNPVTSRDSSALGYWELRDNNVTGPADFTKFNITWSASDSAPSKDASDWTTTGAFPVSLGYSYSAQPAQCVKDGLKNVAGAGKGLATLKCN